VHLPPRIQYHIFLICTLLYSTNCSFIFYTLHTARVSLRKWTTDVSQFNFSWGKYYLSLIIDMQTNEVISYDLLVSPNLNQISRILDTEFKKFESFTGLIFHSDQG